jgi:hypothetical protein
MAMTIACQACLSWDGTKSACEGLEKLYAKEPPAGPSEWSTYAGMLFEAELTEKASLVLEEARRRYPDLELVESLPSGFDLGDPGGPYEEEGDETGE